jgi:hypothetical protein
LLLVAHGDPLVEWVWALPPIRLRPVVIETLFTARW